MNVRTGNVADMRIHCHRAAVANDEFVLDRVRDGGTGKALSALIGGAALQRTLDVVRGADNGFGKKSGGRAAAQAEHGSQKPQMREKRIVDCKPGRCKFSASFSRSPLTADRGKEPRRRACLTRE